MTTLFTLALIAWLAVFAYTAPAVVSIFLGRARNADPWRLACSGFAFLSIAGALRWLIAPNNVEALAAIFIVSICIALYTVHTAWSVGRGPRV